MEGWALWTAAGRDVVEGAFRDALDAHGFQLLAPAAAGRASTSRAQLFRHAAGTLLLLEYEIPNLALARDVTSRLGMPAHYLELRLEDRAVAGRITELPDGASEDVDDAAYEILNDWNEGEDRKFRSEAFPGLVEALFDLPEGRAPTVVTFASSTSPRVAALVRMIRNGGRWERTTIGTQPAIRVIGAEGSQISVLSPAEESELLAALGPPAHDDAPIQPAPQKQRPVRKSRKSRARR